MVVDKQVDATKLASSIREEQSDWWLAFLVGFVNRTPLSFTITLNVSGLLVSGTVVGGKEYFEGVAEVVSQGFPTEENLQGLIRQLIAAPAEIYVTHDKSGSKSSTTDEQQPAAVDASAEDDEQSPGFIHLKDARFWSPAGPLPFSQQRGIWWRGRIQAIDGFIFGEPGWSDVET
jgi:hypothetical protein